MKLKATPLRKLNTAWVLIAAFVVIVVCETFLILDIMVDIFYLDIGLTLFTHNTLELLAVISLAVSLLTLGIILYVLLQERRSYERLMRAASGEFARIVEVKFEEWMLSPSERAIAFMLIKGYSVQEISEMRDTRPGTVKSQSNAIYRKAGVRGRNELVAYFVEDLLGGDNLVASSQPSPSPASGTDEMDTIPSHSSAA